MLDGRSTGPATHRGWAQAAPRTPAALRAATWPAGPAPLRRAREPHLAQRPQAGTGARAPDGAEPPGPPVPCPLGPPGRRGGFGAGHGTHTPAKDAATRDESSGRGTAEERGPPGRAREMRPRGRPRDAAGDAGEAVRAPAPPRRRGPPRDPPRGCRDGSQRETPTQRVLPRRSRSKRLGTGPQRTRPPSAVGSMDSSRWGGTDRPARAA